MSPFDPDVTIDVVVLDAMGVLFAVGDDVGELLTPFVAERGGHAAAVADAYLAASLGACDADAFWFAVGLDGSVEDAYLERLRLMPGVESFLAQVRAAELQLMCLSNDLARWADKLQRRFGLVGTFDLYLTSAVIGCRKPDPRAFQALIDRAAVPAQRMLFIDDRAVNVSVAREHGLRAVLFSGTFPS